MLNIILRTNYQAGLLADYRFSPAIMKFPVSLTISDRKPETADPVLAVILPSSLEQPTTAATQLPPTRMLQFTNHSHHLATISSLYQGSFWCWKPASPKDTEGSALPSRSGLFFPNLFMAGKWVFYQLCTPRLLSTSGLISSTSVLQVLPTPFFWVPDGPL